jgi:hypothetical protein
MAQNYVYPSSSSVTLTGTPNNAPIPSTSILVAGENPSGNQTVFQMDAGGALLVSPLTTSSIVTVVQPDGSLLHATIDASALPSGAATSANQSTEITHLTSIDTKTPAQGAALIAASTPVNIASDQVVPVSASALPLPSGAATAALQTSGNASLSSIDTKTPALGQALAAASVPVVLTASQLSTLTPLTSVTVTQATGTNLHTVVDSGSITATQATGSNLHVQVDAGSAIIGKVGIDQTTPGTTNGVQVNAALPAGTNNIGKVSALAATPTALTVTQAAITVGTSAVRLTVSGSAPASTRVVLAATPDTTSTATFYIGSATVTNSGATRGIEIVAGQSFIANNDAGDYYIVSSTGSQTVTVMEQA